VRDCVRRGRSTDPRRTIWKLGQTRRIRQAIDAESESNTKSCAPGVNSGESGDSWERLSVGSGSIGQVERIREAPGRRCPVASLSQNHSQPRNGGPRGPQFNFFDRGPARPAPPPTAKYRPGKPRHARRRPPAISDSQNGSDAWMPSRGARDAALEDLQGNLWKGDQHNQHQQHHRRERKGAGEHVIERHVAAVDRRLDHKARQAERRRQPARCLAAAGAAVRRDARARKNW